MSLVYSIAQLIILSASSVSATLGFIISALMAYTTLAARGLGDAAKAVLRHLDAGDIDAARKELSLIVGRDTAELDEEEIARAVIETVAENSSDGVTAPLFFMAIGGPALAMAYKAVNTMDSMLGYKNEKYINFGRAAARLDDAANFIPARITAVLICLSVDMLRWLSLETPPHLSPLPPGERIIGQKRQIDEPYPPSPFRGEGRGEGSSEICNPQSKRRNAWRIMLRDGRNHPSPNSGWPEAAMAGALGVRLGGLSSYFGRISQKPYIGDVVYRTDKIFIAKAVSIMYCSTLFGAMGAALAAAII